ncbi:MAG: cysteine desulfurase [Nitratireductor sp.]|nr:cysteine desulfurase [Nitratireductor sp.]
MPRERLYLDYNATAPLLDAARAAMNHALETGGNASSVHSEGRAARALVEQARRQLGGAIAAAASQIVFTSGASEAAAHALSPLIRAGGTDIPVSRLYVSAIEHPCVLAGGRFAADRVEILPVTQAGVIDLAALEAALKAHDRSQGSPMVAVMLANNETGAVQPVRQVADLVHAHDGFLVVDAVQAFGRMPLSIADLQAHFVILSSHKIGGPQGAGALVFGDASISPAPMIRGGGQENFQRAGTENVAAIAGFGAAAASADIMRAKSGEIAAWRDSLESGISTICAEAGNKAGDPVFFARGTGHDGALPERLANTSCFAVPGIKAETALIALDLAGIAVSSGSACSSGKVKKSHVLKAMGVNDELAACALRVSAGPQTTKEDAERFLGAFRDITNRIAA